MTHSSEYSHHKMSKNKRTIFFVFVLSVSLLIIGYFSIKPAYRRLSDYLSKTERVEANVLIVEGWLPESAIETAHDEYLKKGYKYIITTGLKLPSDYLKVPMDGYLIFYPGKSLYELNDPGPHTIDILARSELGGRNRAHFNVFVNDSLVSDFLADKRKRIFSISWKSELTRIDSIMVQFDNDTVGEFGDRNLFVKEIIIDHKITIPYKDNSVYDINKLDGKNRVVNNITSFAVYARNRLISLGIDSSIIIPVPANSVKINRTLTSALAVRDWLEESEVKIEGINIVSEGTHARRTWMTYNRILNGSRKIGIISFPDYRTSHKKKLLYTLRQTIAIIYYWIILIPY